MNKHRTVGNKGLAGCLGRLNIDTEDMHVEKDFQSYNIDMEIDYEGFVADSVNAFFYNHQDFRYNSSQCNFLCHAFIAKLSKYFANNWHILSPSKKVRFTKITNGIDVWRSGDRGKKVMQRAWKEIYRVVKEAQIYLQDCSNVGKWGMKSITSSIDGEAYTLHIHNLVLSLICLEMNYLYLQDETEQSYTETSCRKISDFQAEMSNSIRIDDDHHNIFQQLLKACEMGDDKVSPTVEERNKLGIEKFLSTKLEATIRGEPAVIGSRVCSWLQIDLQHLILRQRFIGSGNFGEIYEGSWLGVKVAVKEIPLFNGDMDYLAPEIAAHAKLHSPFVVQLIGICITHTHCHFVMELADSSLDKILKDRSKEQMPPLALPVAVDMMLQISMGMEYLHSQKIMHMDLKASNVLIQFSALPEFREHGYGRAKICDFGDASLRLSSFRYPEDTKGTCKWRAPEVFSYAQQETLEMELNAPKQYTYKADVYSFAMTCYEILTGKYPFEDVLLEKTIYEMVVRGQRPSMPPFCPSVLADFIKKCWDTDPNRRPCFTEISNFMRLVKMLIMRSEDSSDWDSLSAICRDFDKAQLVKFECNQEGGADNRVPNSVEDGLLRCFLQQTAKTCIFVSLPNYIQQYSYKEMQNATGNFSVEVGGISGLMWKGTMSDGIRVVVKKEYFEISLTKIRMLCLMHHPNALRLSGISAGDEAFLVFDHMVIGSLAAKLFSPVSILNWTKRRKIGLGIARFLAYLHNDHTTRYLNLPINATNVYLDELFTAKLGDFESIMRMPIEVSSQSPSPWDQQGLELALQFEEFRNVHDFGVILLELLMGRRWEDMQYSLQSICNLIQGDEGSEVIGERLLDRALKGEVDMGEAMRWVRVALWCLVRSPWLSPNMNMVLLAMRGQFEVCPLPENMFKNYPLGQREYITSQEQCSHTQLSEMWGEWENYLRRSTEMDWHGLAEKNRWMRDDSVAGSVVESSSPNPPWFQRLGRSEKSSGIRPSMPTDVEDFLRASDIHDLQVFELKEIRLIARNFRLGHQLGEGEFGSLYKGYIDDSVRQGFKGMPVAVKVLNQKGQKAFEAHRRWLGISDSISTSWINFVLKAKLNFFGRLQRHPHLVKLVGFCFEGVVSALVYEFMPRGSLCNHLFRRGPIPLPWRARLKIAVGAAKGLAFLHEGQKPFVHGDFNASDILLDSDYTAKLSDIWIAVAEAKGEEIYESQLTRPIMGRFGFEPPVYVTVGRSTTRLDVYSFGVVLLELLTGRSSSDKNMPREQQNLVEWARPQLLDQEKLMCIMDQRLEGQYSVKAARKAASLVYQCTNVYPKYRPSMKDIVEILEPLQNMTHETSVTSLHNHRQRSYRSSSKQTDERK